MTTRTPSPTRLEKTQPITMPALSPTMTRGAVAEWKVTEGQTIAAGDVLADIETDKATMALESMEDGVVAKILVQNGAADVEVGTVLGVIAEDAADVGAFADYEAPPPPEETDASGGAERLASPLDPVSSLTEPSNAPDPDLGRVWPSVRRLLAESGLDGSGIPPTGPKRTLTKGDVLAAMGLCAPPRGSNDSSTVSKKPPKASSSRSPDDAEDAASCPQEPQEPTEPSFDDLAVTPTRRVIASRLLESKTGAPHHYVEVDVGLASVAALRERLKRDGVRVSVNDCVMYAVSRALRTCPALNASWNEARGVAERLHKVDVAVAVATPNGLITPVVRDADLKSLVDIGGEIRESARRAREGRLKPEEYTGGSFTVSNLGMFPIDSFAAILNPPQGAIMAVGRGRDFLSVDERDSTKLVSTPRLSATVSADARAADAADVARFLEAFKDALENPEGGDGKEKWAL